MNRHTATTTKPLPLNEAKATLSRLVGEGKVRSSTLKLIDIRESTPREKEIGEAIGRARARKGKAA